MSRAASWGHRLRCDSPEIGIASQASREGSHGCPPSTEGAARGRGLSAKETVRPAARRGPWRLTELGPTSPQLRDLAENLVAELIQRDRCIATLGCEVENIATHRLELPDRSL